MDGLAGIQYRNQKYEDWNNSGCVEDYITIFTPTYNRASLIHRVYECLLMQNNQRFIWIVVNDGSIDNTAEVMQSILEKNEIPILFISKPNGGKHSAFETAFNETRTEFFMCMDDDDIYSSYAVNTYLEEWARIKAKGEYDIIGAIRTLTQNENGQIVSRKPFDKGLIGVRKIQTTLESNYKNHEYFENWTCYRLDALRNINLFSKDYWLSEHHKFFSEAIWQGRFARKYKCCYYNIVLREYRHDTETSIIRSEKDRQHYLDMFINTKMCLDEQLDYIRRTPCVLLKDIAIVSILRYRLGISLFELLHFTNSILLKACYLMTTPIAWVVRFPKINE